jgi:hypothetical protein
MRGAVEDARERVVGGVVGVGIWLKHRFKRAVEPITPAMVVLSIAAAVGALSAVLVVLAAREYHRQ